MSRSEGRGVGYSGRAGGFDARKSAISFASWGVGEAGYGWRDSLTLMYSYIPGDFSTHALMYINLPVSFSSNLDVHRFTRELQLIP